MQDHMMVVSYSKGDTNENYIQQVLSLSLCVYWDVGQLFTSSSQYFVSGGVNIYCLY